MIRVGITGQSGFVGTHLYNMLGLFPDEFEHVPFEDAFFKNDFFLINFVRQCDVIVHLAAINRHINPQNLYNTNLKLVNQLIGAMEAANVKPHVLFSSSTQEESDNEYGKSKREGRELLEIWAKKNSASFTGMVVPNVFGPFGLPNYNSFIATFCHQLTHGDNPIIIKESKVRLIYIGNLCSYIIKKIRDIYKSVSPAVETDWLSYDFERSVSEILLLFEKFKNQYFIHGYIPELRDTNEINLFNTFRSYIDLTNHFPIKLVESIDSRGLFVETIKLGIGGQVSYSTTFPGFTRGNHFHTRKIERFIVIKGKALIQLRKIGTTDIINLNLDGRNPSFVDIPIWYTHNIKNIGTEELYTQFWINEWFNPEDRDTFYEPV